MRELLFSSRLSRALRRVVLPAVQLLDFITRLGRNTWGSPATTGEATRWLTTATPKIGRTGVLFVAGLFLVAVWILSRKVRSACSIF